MPDSARRGERPLSIAMLALGGQGGGVLTNWLVDLAEHGGYLAQSTYVAGVAQRTGSTVYCVEMFPKDRLPDGVDKPVFTPYPVPGDVDLVLTGELAETGRAIQKGFVTPNQTTLIASSHRVYSITEKTALGDGIVDQTPVVDVARRASRRFVAFDMQAAADETGSVISAVMLGAIAGSGALPFDRDAFEETIRRGGRAVERNLAGFALGFERSVEAPSGDITTPDGEAAPEAPVVIGANGRALAARIDSSLPEPVRSLALHGALRALDYQDVAYAEHYLERLGRVASAEQAVDASCPVSCEVARQLALQMCYEDTIRVAELKTRRERFARIRAELAARIDQPVRVVEYFHPRFEEVCDTLPAGLGKRLIGSERARRWFAPLFSRGRNLTTSSLSGYLLLRTVAAFGRFRRSTYRYRVQQEFIDDWLARILSALDDDPKFAYSLARAIEIVRGYSDTYERGLDRFRRAVDAASAAPATDRAARLDALIRAAQTDEAGRAFEATLSEGAKAA